MYHIYQYRAQLFSNICKVLFPVNILFCFLISFYFRAQKHSTNWRTQFHEKHCCQEPKGSSCNLSHTWNRCLGDAKGLRGDSPFQRSHIPPPPDQSYKTESFQSYKIEDFQNTKLRRSKVYSRNTSRQ